MKEKIIKIVFAGGGTGGSVSPLLAVYDELKKIGQQADFLWIGTKTGPEKKMVENEKISYLPICSGKLRRYFSWQNFIDPFLVLIGFFQSVIILLKFKAKIVLSAGGFVSVPVVWAAWILGIKIIIHQQDIRPGMANKFMAPSATLVTVTFEKSIQDYPKKSVWIGNPTRILIADFSLNKRSAREKLGLAPNMPTVLVVGGGTGAAFINNLIQKSLPELAKFCQLVHITGQDKLGEQPAMANYKAFPFLLVDGMAKALNSADIVISRCGMGLLTELSILGKPAILIPIPNSHQEDNALVFSEKNAAIVLKQSELDQNKLVKAVKDLITDENKKSVLAENIKKIIKKDANKAMLDLIYKIIEE